MSHQSTIAIINNAYSYGQRIAISDNTGDYTYSDLLRCSASIASTLLQERDDLNESRVCFIVPSGFLYTAVKWGIWRAGGVSVPLCITHPQEELEYVIRDCMCELVIAHSSYVEKVYPITRRLGKKLIVTDDLLSREVFRDLPLVLETRRSMILYTSGTTSKPKGVVTTHKNIECQIKSLVQAWKWREDDCVLNVLPLHHLHGILNLLLCPLWVGARCEMHEKFRADEVWSAIGQGRITVFMAVPTIYYKLIEYWELFDRESREKLSGKASKLRLMVSGSSSLSVSVFKKWRAITSHFLLERYGMTEIGMALSNPLEGERIPGYVGTPLPSVLVELMDEKEEIIAGGDVTGEIVVKGGGVFLEYWNRPKETKRAFKDGWFKTGDIAYRDKHGRYKILGRKSVDIIKSGGYKISALEIEEVFRSHPAICECAVVGIADEKWGEKIALAIVAKKEEKCSLKEFREWGSKRIARYKLPSSFLIFEKLPKNVMGKVRKDILKAIFECRVKETLKT